MQDFRMATFLAVCGCMNYTRAAEALNITQPAVSQHIRYLEDHYGVSLFYYEGKKLRLTKAGRLLCSAATTIKHDEMLLQEQINSGERQKLVFGATRTIGDFVLPEKLARYIRDYPETELQMSVDNTLHLLKGIDDGILDFAIIEGYFHKAEYDYKVFTREQYIAVCAASYPFIRAPKTIGDLFNEPIILRESGSGTREILERHLEDRNLSLKDFNRVIEIGSIHAIKSLVSSGIGITFIYEAAVKSELASGLFRRIPLTDFDVSHNFTLVWRKNSIYQERYDKIFNTLLRS